MAANPKIKLEQVERFERDYTLRLPFRFGVITVTEGTQAVIRATIALEDGRTATGVAAEALAAKWFDKSPAFSDAQNVEQLRQAIGLAADLYRARGWSTPFGLYADAYRDQMARGAELGLVPLVASYGPALLDRAILDALGRALGLSFAEMIAPQRAGHRAAAASRPILRASTCSGSSAICARARRSRVRHTVGLVDPIVAADQKAGERVDDGLPETLEEVVRHYGCRYYKLKVGGDVAADLDRLTRIAGVLDRSAGEYRATLDGNEQYDAVEGIAELWRRMRETPALERLVAATLFIEQPIKRASALEKPVDALARLKPMLIDEFDGEIGTFPAAHEARLQRRLQQELQGPLQIDPERGAGREAQRRGRRGEVFHVGRGPDDARGGERAAGPGAGVAAGPRAMSSATAIISSTACRSRRKGEQAAFARAHPDLYERSAGPARLRIRDGRLALGSLACPGFAVAADMDFAAMRAMPAPQAGRIEPAFPEKLK